MHLGKSIKTFVIYLKTLNLFLKIQFYSFKMQIKYYGHSSFSVNVGEKVLLFDPFISPNELANNIDIMTLKVDYILISHAHFDHIADVVAIAKNCNATIVANWEIGAWAEAQGIEKVHRMNIGGFWEFDFGKLQMVKAVHSSSFPDGSYGGNPVGFVISGTDKTFYYSGDTALNLDMQLIPQRHNLDFAFLPIGNCYTMDVTDAVTASNFIKCNHIIGMHYDTFGYIKINHQDAINQFNIAGKILTLMNIEQTLEF